MSALYMRSEPSAPPKYKKGLNHGDMAAVRNIILGALYVAVFEGGMTDLENQFKYVTRPHYGWAASDNDNVPRDFLEEIFSHISQAFGVEAVNPGQAEAKLGRIEHHIEKIVDIIEED